MQQHPIEHLPVILVAGFGPFGGESTNPSWDAASFLDGVVVEGHRIVARCLPVEFGRALERLHDAMAEVDPVLVLCVGQAGGRTRLSLERVAINIDDARIADNAGATPVDEPIFAGGPAAYFTTLPVKAMLSALHAAGIPAEVSQTAGTYVCNHVFYGLMHTLRDRPQVRGGFVHVPFSPCQAADHPGAASLPVEIIVDGLRTALKAALTTTHDLRLPAGSDH